MVSAQAATDSNETVFHRQGCTSERLQRSIVSGEYSRKEAKRMPLPYPAVFVIRVCCRTGRDFAVLTVILVYEKRLLVTANRVVPHWYDFLSLILWWWAAVWLRNRETQCLPSTTTGYYR